MAGARESGGRAMRDVLYLVVVVIAFGICYAVYGLGVVIMRLIRCRHGCRPSSPDGAQKSHSVSCKM